ncbi:MAG: hypothetical protein E7141_06285 [Rikenellaceae bacterium]|nr:hypothetical protein [Rikenellaceae bacterium]
MKRIIYSLVAIVSLLAVSCVQEDTSVTQPIGSEALVSISVGNGSASRAIAKGEDTNELLYAVYDADWKLLFTRDVELPATLTYKVEEKLLTGYTYHFVFWAQKEGTYTPEWGTVGQVSVPTVTIDYTNVAANDDSRDAFFGQVEVAVEGTTNKSVELKRPFAQINHGTNDLVKAADAGFNTAALKTELKVSAYNTLYLNGGAVDGLTEVTFASASRDAEMTTLDTDYDWISMNYVLWTAEESSLGECTLTMTDGVKTIGVKYPQAPARRNYRTNLLGALLTDSANVNVEVKPGTEGDLNNPNGYYVKDGVYHIQNATGLDWLAEQVNGGNSFSGVKFVLDGDIDLSATRTLAEWTPIGTFEHAFSGSFDGSGYTVRNFQVTALEGHAGLFGYITLGGPIQNLTVENVKIVANHYAGGIVGRGYVDIENCHVNNVDITLSVKNNDWSDKAGGVIGQMMEGSSTTKNCTAKNVSIKGYRDLGGIAGMAHDNNTVTGCSVENITIVQDISVDYEAATPTTLGGVVGRQGSNVTYENNTETNVNIGTGANNETEMKAAIAANAATIIVNGEIDLAQVNLNNYCGTIVGADDTAALSTRNYTPGNDEGYWLINGAENHSITFKNIDIKFPTGGDWLKSGFASRGANATLVFENCDFEGQATLNGGATWIFNDCDFVSTELDKYASFVYGAKKATFNRCSFSGVDRAAKVYGSGGVLDVEYNTCEYTSSTLNKSGVEIDASYATTTVNLNNCSQTAMAGLYALKGTKGTVYVDGVANAVLAYTAEQLAQYVNDATKDTTVVLANDIEATSTVLLKQKEGVNVIIEGKNKNFNGLLSIRGYKQYGTSTLTIKDIHFTAASATSDACIVGEDRKSTGVYAYSHGVTVDNCTFSCPISDDPKCAAVRHKDGGDSNWTITNCVVDSSMHSLIQTNNILGNLKVEECKVYSKNGANLNYTCKAEFTDCKFDVRGLAVRVGVNSGGNPDEAKTFTFTDCNLKSACEDGDAVIIVRTSAQNATLKFVNTTLEGTTKISGIVDGKTNIEGTY